LFDRHNYVENLNTMSNAAKILTSVISLNVLHNNFDMVKQNYFQIWLTVSS